MTESVAELPFKAPSISRQYGAGTHTCVVQRRGVREFHLTILPLPDESPARMFQRLAAYLRAHSATVVRHEVFGTLAARSEFIRVGQQLFGGEHWPVTWVEGASCAGDAVAGMHVWAVAGARVETHSGAGRVVGRSFDDGHARHCVLGEIYPKNGAVQPAQQALQVFESMEAALRPIGMTMPNVVRTWLFLDDILAWYGPLNQVRREFFEQRRLFAHTVPASTGVGMRNPAGAALVAGAWAVLPTNGSLYIGEVGSPMQCPAPAYGSCFSRAVEMVTSGWRRLLISGTASIAPKGDSVCANDLDGQIDLTMQVVRAILVSRELDYADVTRATAYLRHPVDAPVFLRWCGKLGLANWPLIVTQAVVCRDELLFEIELDAIAPVRDRSSVPAGTPATQKS